MAKRTSSDITTTSNRRMRGFKRWMKSQGIEYSDALVFTVSPDNDDTMNISVKTICDLREGDVIATIPKESCLTVMTSAASQLVEEAELGGYLGLAVAIMYEKSLGAQSKWFQYLQLLPRFEPIPLLWSLHEIDSLLVGTELHKIIKEDKAIVHQDWKECIKPLLTGGTSVELNPDFFTVDEYLAAKSLIASRSFQIDEYHGSGMVPLADLFNHKTAAEDVHFTATSPSSDSEMETDNIKEDTEDSKEEDDEPIDSDSDSELGEPDGNDVEISSAPMEMIMIKDVKAGTEVFNTYGSLGNAALLHRYGFTEPDNPFDVLNIDLDIVVQWSLSLFSCRHSRRRVSLWRKLDYSCCVTDNSEYFEVSFDGEPQMELLVLLYIMLLPEKDYDEVELALLATGEVTKDPRFHIKENILCKEGSELSRKLLLTPGVQQALLSLADAREGLYGQSTMEDDIKSLKEYCHATDRKVYHSLWLRISERRIIEKLRLFANPGAANSSSKGSRSRTKKRLHRD